MSLSGTWPNLVLYLPYVLKKLTDERVSHLPPRVVGILETVFFFTLWNKGKEEEIFRFSVNLILTPDPLEHGAGLSGGRNIKERPRALARNKRALPDIHFV